MDTAAWLTIGEVARRAGVAPSALRFYESCGLIESVRNSSGHRRYPRAVLRRVAFIRAAQRVGLTLEEIRDALATLPRSRTPTKADWARLSRAWRQRLDQQILLLERLRDTLTSCIGCGCLSLRTCALYNPGDRASAMGPGPRYLTGDLEVGTERPAGGAAAGLGRTASAGRRSRRRAGAGPRRPARG